MANDEFALGCRDMRIVFERTAGSSDGYGYRLDLRDGEAWRPVSASGNPLVRGGTFNLFPTTLRQEGAVLRGEGVQQAKSTTAEALEYSWTARIEADEKRGWFHFDVAVASPAVIRLPMAGGYEPEITLDLGLLPPYERGDHVWFKTGITNPTTWNDEAFGNDFPATYYYDPYLQLELMMFFDMTAMNWMSFDNIARFLNYRCGFRRRYRPAPAAEVGLYADGFSGQVFPAGEHSFRYSITANPRGDTPHAPLEQEALAMLVARCLELVPGSGASPWPQNATSWSDFSRNCARDMSDSDHSWGSDEHGEFILNYVDGYSPAWKEAIEARGRPFDMLHPCLESALWAAHPLATICAIEPTEEYHALQDRLLRFANATIRERRTFITTGLAQQPAPVGTWQYVYIMEEAWQIAMFGGDSEAAAMLEEEANEILIPLARSVRHIFPLEFDKSTLRKYGNGDAHAIAGLYSFFMLDLYKATGKDYYLDEARQAIKVLYNLPVNSVSQEVFLLAQGAQAASRLYELEGDEEYATIYRYLAAQTLRMMYWYRDLTSERSRDVNVLGMYQACATIIYTALLENIDVVARLASTFKLHGANKSLLNAINHARINNFYFYPRCLPEQYHTSSLLYIPHENIPLLEGPKPASVGQEIYGAGFTFRAYLLWEAWGRADNRDVMVLNLNNYEERELLQAPEKELWFAVYNGAHEAVSTNLYFPPVASHAATVQQATDWEDWSEAAPLDESKLALDLAPEEMLYLRVKIRSAG